MVCFSNFMIVYGIVYRVWWYLICLHLINTIKVWCFWIFHTCRISISKLEISDEKARTFDDYFRIFFSEIEYFMIYLRIHFHLIRLVTLNFQAKAICLNFLYVCEILLLRLLISSKWFWSNLISTRVLLILLEETGELWISGGICWK